ASAQPGCADRSSTGADAWASTPRAGSASTTFVLVLPTSMPRVREAIISVPWSGRVGRVDETLRAVRVDRVPGVAVDFQRAADDAAVRVLEVLPDGLRPG